MLYFWYRLFIIFIYLNGYRPENYFKLFDRAPWKRQRSPSESRRKKIAIRLEFILKNSSTCEFIDDESIDFDEGFVEYEEDNYLKGDESVPDAEFEDVEKNMETGPLMEELWQQPK